MIFDVSLVAILSPTSKVNSQQLIAMVGTGVMSFQRRLESRVCGMPHWILAFARMTGLIRFKV